MPQTNYDKRMKELGEEARTSRDSGSLSVEEARQMHESGEGVIVDIRDIRELWRDGRIPGSFHAPRGMLEFWIDPDTAPITRRYLR